MTPGHTKADTGNGTGSGKVLIHLAPPWRLAAVDTPRWVTPLGGSLLPKKNEVNRAGAISQVISQCSLSPVTQCSKGKCFRESRAFFDRKAVRTQSAEEITCPGDPVAGQMGSPDLSDVGQRERPSKAL